VKWRRAAVTQRSAERKQVQGENRTRHSQRRTANAIGRDSLKLSLTPRVVKLMIVPKTSSRPWIRDEAGEGEADVRAEG
jgi:hypothetical protein